MSVLWLVSECQAPAGVVMKLPLEVDEPVTGSSLTWSGNSWPGQASGR